MKEKLLSNLSKFLGDVSINKPCGDDISDSFQALDLETLRQIEPVIDPEIAQSIEKWGRPEWKKTEVELQGFLTKTRDLRLLVIYIRVAVHAEQRPLIGLIKGQLLILNYLENHWDCLYPVLDKEEEDPHFDRFNSLANLGGEFWQLASILRKKVNILSIDLGNYTLNDLVTLQSGGSVEDKQPLVGLMEDEEQAYAELVESFELSLELTQKINAILLKKSGEAFGDFDKFVLPLLKDGCSLNSDKTMHSTDTENKEESATQAETSKAHTKQQSVSGAINNRTDIVKAIDLICDYYSSNEPSSPVPLILKRAKKMVNMDYREIFRELNLGSDSHLEGAFGRPDEDSQYH